MLYTLRVNYNPNSNSADYRSYFDEIRKLNEQDLTAALSVMVGVAFDALIRFKHVPKSKALEDLLYCAGLSDLRKVPKGGVTKSK